MNEPKHQARRQGDYIRKLQAELDTARGAAAVQARELAAARQALAGSEAERVLLNEAVLARTSQRDAARHERDKQGQALGKALAQRDAHERAADELDAILRRVGIGLTILLVIGLAGLLITVL